MTEQSTRQPEIAEYRPRISTAISTIIDTVRRVTEHGIILTEAMTEAVIIDPLLATLGYAVWEFQKQGIAEGIGSIPDYTILPKQPAQWFLEIKKWMHPLTVKDANQTVGYAFSQGTRWAVLTNGNEWRIYDAHCQAPLAEKCLVTLPALTSPRAADILALLAKPAICANLLTQMQRTQLLAMAIHTALTDPESPAIAALRQTLAHTTLHDVTRDEIATTVQSLVTGSTVPYYHATAATCESSLVCDRPSERFAGSEAELYPIADLATRRPSPSRRTPCSVILPDGSEAPAASWRRVAQCVIEWCAGHYGLPELPFAGISTAAPERYFLAAEPIHPNGRQGRAWIPLSAPGATVYLDGHHSARGFCRLLKALLRAVGIDPATVRVRLTPAPTLDARSETLYA